MIHHKPLTTTTYSIIPSLLDTSLSPPWPLYDAPNDPPKKKTDEKVGGNLGWENNPNIK